MTSSNRADPRPLRNAIANASVLGTLPPPKAQALGRAGPSGWSCAASHWTTGRREPRHRPDSCRMVVVGASCLLRRAIAIPISSRQGFALSMPVFSRAPVFSWSPSKPGSGAARRSGRCTTLRSVSHTWIGISSPRTPSGGVSPTHTASSPVLVSLRARTGPGKPRYCSELRSVTASSPRCTCSVPRCRPIAALHESRLSRRPLRKLAKVTLLTGRGREPFLALVP